MKTTGRFARMAGRLPGAEKGALMLLTLIILLVISMLGMSSVDSTGLEMKMSSNSRDQQAAFEAAEFTLSFVENNLAATGYFSDASLTNTSCGTVCFSSSGTNGYYFSGGSATTTACTLTPPVSPALEPYADPATWSTATRHRTLNIPNSDITAKYIIEYWCWLDVDSTLDATSRKSYRITAYTVGENGARVMLRSVVRQPN